MNYLLIDLSYIVFYRFHALLKYWKMSDRELHESGSGPANTEEFFTHFEKMFEKCLLQLVKRHCEKLTLKNTQKDYNQRNCVILALDCPRGEIWRKEVFPEYKTNRHLSPQSNELIVQIFERLYAKILPDIQHKYGFMKVCKSKGLEADDVISCIIQVINNDVRFEKQKCVIITNDKDYLQLLDQVDDIFNLQGISLKSKLVNQSTAQSLFLKICCGDASDNIKGFLSEGKLNALFVEFSLKQTDNLHEIESKLLGRFNDTQQQVYMLNKRLICFNEIPSNLYDAMVENCYSQIFSNA
jgi:5'-3' exonuclease